MTLREITEERERKTLSPFAALSVQSEGRLWPIEPCPIRTCYQRDIDRIVHSKAFRRLMHKTQCLPARRRATTTAPGMTHTLEVAQIARTAARALRLERGPDGGHRPRPRPRDTRPLATPASGSSTILCPQAASRHAEQSLRVVELAGKRRQGPEPDATPCADGIREHTSKGQSRLRRWRVAIVSPRRTGSPTSTTTSTMPCEGASSTPWTSRWIFPKFLALTTGAGSDTLTLDVIQASRGQDEIRQSPACGEAMAKLREFMFEAVYYNPLAKGEESKAQDMIARLFEHYQTHPDELPPDYQDIRLREGTDRAVCDYIAGMTDHYAVAKYNEAFVPLAWAVK